MAKKDDKDQEMEKDCFNIIDEMVDMVAKADENGKTPTGLSEEGKAVTKLLCLASAYRKLQNNYMEADIKKMLTESIFVKIQDNISIAIKLVKEINSILEKQLDGE